jgi:hypothetical protein
MEISMEKKKRIRFANFKASKVIGVLTNVNFKAKVKKLFEF